MTSPAIFSTTRRVEFSDTDAAGVTHFTRLLAFVEEAEHSLFRERNVPSLDANIGWPRASLDVRFTAPARFGDLLKTEIGSITFQGPFLTYQFVVHKVAATNDAAPTASVERPVLGGTMKICKVERRADGSFQASEIPEHEQRNLLATESSSFSTQPFSDTP